MHIKISNNSLTSKYEKKKKNKIKATKKKKNKIKERLQKKKKKVHERY